MLIRSLLSDKKRPALQTVDVAAAVSAAVATFSGARFRCLPVTENGSLVGVVTIRDLLKFLAAKGGAGMSAPVGEAMTRDPITISVSETIDAAGKLLTGRFNHLPVLEDGAVVGILTPADTLHVRLEDVRGLATDLERYILGG